MAFLNQKKYAKIREAAKSGDEKAKAILMAMIKSSPQEELNLLVEDYFKPAVPIIQPVKDIEHEPAEQQTPPVTEEIKAKERISEVPAKDYLSDIDSDMSGLFDEEDIGYTSFSDFLKSKDKESNRAVKNTDYFNKYDEESRRRYKEQAIEKYVKKFTQILKETDVNCIDMTHAIDFYRGWANENIPMTDALPETASSAYKDFVSDGDVMFNMPRYWDENSRNNVFEKLKSISGTYGRAGVENVLNSLSEDTENYRSFVGGKVKKEVDRYRQTLQKLLG